MHVLLEAGADVDCKDCRMLSPLDYAVERSLIEPIQVLGYASCSLSTLYRSQHPVLHDAIGITNPRRPDSAAETVVDLLVDLIVDRRQKLCDLAVRALPASELAYLYPCGDRGSYVLDEEASRLSSALLCHRIPVPSALIPGRERTTVYHQDWVPLRILEKFWKAGFRDIDGRDSSGLTPLMYMKPNLRLLTCNFPSDDTVDLYLECVKWYLNRGADFYARQDLDLLYERMGGNMPSRSRQLLSATSSHFIARNLGRILYDHIDYLESNHCAMRLNSSISGTSKRQLERIVLDNVPDDCTCACSIRGCEAFTSIIKASESSCRENRVFVFQRLASLWTWVEGICNSLKCSKCSEFLRLITFMELGLTHTCCDYVCVKGRYMFTEIGDQAEIDEIHDEEAADLQKLEELLEEFEAKRIELSLPFLGFLEEYWRPRMVEVLSEGDLDEEALTEIGVKVYKSNSDCL